jgi:uncharacterized protein YgfB (UPF0149 family)
MKNYNLLNSSEIQYLTYVIQQVQKLEQSIENQFSKRDSKLKLLLDENYSDIKKDADKGLKEIIDFINTIDIQNLDRNILENELASKINNFTNWWNYVEEKLKDGNKTKENRTCQSNHIQ